MEQWKEIENTDGLLEVSNYGRVRSNMRDGRILKATPDKKGYLRLRVTIHREKRAYKVHRLVANAFVPNPEGKPQVNHIDGNKTNNRADNLEWVTNLENAHHAMDNDLWSNVFDASRRASEAQRRPIIAYKDGEAIEFESICQAQKFIGTRHITDVLKGKRKQAKGYTFAYKEGGDIHVHHKHSEA